jgi:hypothetical protein
VLEVEERGLVAEGGVVREGEVPREVGGEPDGERDGRPRQAPRTGNARDRAGDGRWEPEHAERGRPLGEDDVLEQVRRQQVVEGDRLERRDRDREDQCEPGKKGGRPPAVAPHAVRRQHVCDRERGHEDERLEVPVPGRGVRPHAGHATGAPLRCPRARA